MCASPSPVGVQILAVACMPETKGLHLLWNVNKVPTSSCSCFSHDVGKRPVFLEALYGDGNVMNRDRTLRESVILICY